MEKLTRFVVMGLLLSLAACGSRKADGTVNASGKVFLYEAGTLTPAFGYSDKACTTPISTTSGAIVLDAAGKRTIYIKTPADVVVTTSDGTQVDALSSFDLVRCELVQVEHAGFTGAKADSSGVVTQALGGFTDLNALLTSAHASFGPDWKRKRVSGATAIMFNDWANGIGVFVTEFGAKCDGLTDDTVAVQAAINEVARLGGGRVLFPPGTCIYGTNGSAWTVSTAGTVLEGSGQGTTTLKCMSTTLGAFTFTSANGVAVRGMRITANAASSGTALAFSGCTGIRVEDVKIDTFDKAMTTASSCSDVTVGSNCNFVANTGVAGARAITLTDTTYVTILGGRYQGSSTTYGIELLGTCANISIFGAFISGAGSHAIRLDAAFSTTGLKVIGVKTTCTDLFSTGLSTDPGGFYQFGNGFDGYTIAVATGATSAAPNRLRGGMITIHASSGGAGNVTVPAPTPTPADTDGVYLTLRFKNGAGGAVGWVLNAAYVLVGGTAPVGTDGTVSVLQFMWDHDTSEWRELSRSNTTT